VKPASLIKKPGVYYDLPADLYHADPCARPSLSRSVAVLMLDRSPWHAWEAHPRLNPEYEAEDERKFDLGTSAHLAMLGDKKEFRIIESDSYRSFAAKRARQVALASGQVPVLVGDHKRVLKMVRAARTQLTAHDEAYGAFTDGKPEVTLIWNEKINGIVIWCRIRLDWLPDDLLRFPDYKSTLGSAHPDHWAAMAYREGIEFQAAFYLRGIRKLLKCDPFFDFVVQESYPPYALSVISLTPAALAMAERDVERALEMWAWCMQRGQWPGYPSKICYIDPPAYVEKSRLEREERFEADRAGGIGLFEFAYKMQSPLPSLRRKRAK
jgi:PDDEXK-like domain of unknown function (DUF3799)